MARVWEPHTQERQTPRPGEAGTGRHLEAQLTWAGAGPAPGRGGEPGPQITEHVLLMRGWLCQEVISEAGPGGARPLP